MKDRSIGNCSARPTMARTRQGSWNHAKIIAADGQRAIVGGHNLWPSVYLENAPVHDVSGLFEGAAVRTAHGFADYLWRNAGRVLQFSPAGPQHDKTINFASPDSVPHYHLPDTSFTPGASGVLALGRLGNLGSFSFSSNASVTARVIALCQARSFIRISQQSILGLGPLPYDFPTCMAIVRALRENVQVQIVLSNELRNYGGSAGKVLEFLKVLYLADVYAKGSFRQFPARTDVEGWAKLTEGSSALCSIDEIYETLHDKPRHGEERIIADFNSKLKLARLHYSENMDKWMVDGKSIEAGNHAKVYIVDDKCFYVGSDNMYESLDRRGLQEFGYLVNDQAETQKFLKLYWEPLWRYSGKHALTASV